MGVENTYTGVGAYKMWNEEMLVVSIWGIVELVVFAFYFIFGISNDVITIRLGEAFFNYVGPKFWVFFNSYKVENNNAGEREVVKKAKILST